MKPLGMDCAEALELIFDRDALPEAGQHSDRDAHERRLALEAHLRTCANCAAQSKGLDMALAALRAGSAVEGASGSLDLWPSLRATLAAEGRFAVPGAPRTVETAPALQRARWRWTRVASFASAAAVLAIALPLLWKQTGRPTTDPSSPTSGSTAPVAFEPRGSNSEIAPQQGSRTPTAPELAGQVAADAPASADPASAHALGTTDTTGKGGLRRALGEKRQREFATPYDASGESGAWSLASDRELR